MKPILIVNHLNVKVGDRTLIRDLSFKIIPGTLTCITGGNGVGKTTLMKTLLRNYSRTGKHVRFTVPRHKVQYIPQFRNIDTEFPLTVKDFVSLSLQDTWLPWLTRREHKALKQTLQLTHLTKLANEPLGEASGGEQQRAFLAQALVTFPKLLIMDETTASLDINAKVALLKLVHDIVKQRHVAVMFITHDPTLVKWFGNYKLRIKNQHGSFEKIGGRN
ncbi:ATP-binding cassette domain-containing protein [uncultured bacterium]|nr:ATP-binding cassette domain-containing protein [uncultured bacterium]